MFMWIMENLGKNNTIPRPTRVTKQNEKGAYRLVQGLNLSTSTVHIACPITRFHQQTLFTTKDTANNTDFTTPSRLV